MSKKNVRLLASGFLFSGLLLLVLNFIDPAETAASDQDTVEDLEAEIRYLEEVAVSFELENEQLLSEISTLTQGSANESESDTEEDIEEDDQENATESAETEEETDEEDIEQEEQDSVTEYTVVVREGEPSSVVAAQLESFGLISDYHDFNTYMEDNDLFRQLRPGEYTVQSDMTREQLVAAIIR